MNAEDIMVKDVRFQGNSSTFDTLEFGYDVFSINVLVESLNVDMSFSVISWYLSLSRSVAR